MVKKANEIWRDGPSSAPYEPPKPDIREWGSEVEENLVTDNLRQVIRSPFFQNVHKKAVVAEGGSKWADYDAVKALGSYAMIYPQAFAIDKHAGELFILSEASGGTDSKNWVTVYNWPAFTYKRCFAAGEGISEGIRVYRAGGNRYLITKRSGTDLGRYDITTLPANMSTATSVATLAAGLRSKWTTLPDGRALVSAFGSAIGTYTRYTQYEIKDALWNRVGVIEFPLHEVGYSTSDENSLAPYLPKWQGIAAGGGFLAAGVGGSYNITQTATPYQYQGVKVYDLSGEKILESIIQPAHFISVLNAAGVDAYRIENEGVWVDPDTQEIYSLWVTGWHADPGINPLVEGLVILREFATEEDALDFSAGSAFYATPDDNFGVKRSSNQFVNYFTGVQFTTLSGVLDYMARAEKREWWTYTSSTPLTDDINGGTVPASTKLTFWNIANTSMFVEYLSTSDQAVYLATYSGSVWTMARVQPPILRLRIRTTAEILALSPSPAGQAHYCSDGDHGAPCLAISTGAAGTWKAVKLGDTISAT